MSGIPSLKVTEHTNLQDLHAFLQDTGKKSKVYGSKDEEGVITLYLKPKAETWKEKIADKFQSLKDSWSGVAAQRRDIAREGIQTLFDRASKDLPEESTLRHIADSVKNKSAKGFDQDRNKAHRAGQLSRIAELTSEIVELAEKAPPKPPGETALEKMGLGMNNVSPDFGDHEPPIIGMYNERAKPVEIDGVRYNPVKHLGAGGFGNVYLYKSEDGTKTIAFKITKSKEVGGDDSILHAAAKEIENHKTLAETSPESTIGFIGAIRLPGGQVGLATEFAPHGDMQGMSRKIDSMIAPDENNIQPGQITREEANVLKLTLLRDTAQGLDAIHSTSDTTHYDFKSGNVLVDEHGKAKIADFGTTFKGQTIDPNLHERIDSSFYKAPEIQYAYTTGATFKKDANMLVDHLYKQEARRLKRDLQELFPKSRNCEELALSVFANRKAKITEDQSEALSNPNLTLVNAKKVDIWGLGATGVDMFTGKPMLSEVSTFMSQTDRRLLAFRGDDGATLALRPLVDGQVPGNSLAGSTGDPEIDNFLNGILVGDPTRRPSAKEIVDHDIFKRKGVGSPSAYDLMVAIGKGDTQEIDRLRKKLAEN